MMLKRHSCFALLAALLAVHACAAAAHGPWARRTLQQAVSHSAEGSGPVAATPVAATPRSEKNYVVEFDVTYHDGPSLNKFSATLAGASFGLLLAPPAVDSKNTNDRVVAALARTSSDGQGGVMSYSEADTSWLNTDGSCDPGVNAPVISDNVVYQGCAVRGAGWPVQGGVHALDLETGATLWRWYPSGARSGDIYYNTIVHAVTDDLVIVSTGPRASPECGNGTVTAFSKSDLSEVWSINKPWAMTKGVLHQGRLYMAYHCGDVVALDPLSGKTLWAKSWSSRDPRNIQSSQLVVYNNEIYVGARGALRVIDLEGNERWTYYLDKGDPDIVSGPVVAQPSKLQAEAPFVYIGTARGRLIAIQAREACRVFGAATNSEPDKEAIMYATPRWVYQREEVSTDPNVPTIANVLPILTHGTLLLSTWDGWILEMTMDTGERRSSSVAWYGQTGIMSPVGFQISQQGIWFTRGNKIYSNQMPTPDSRNINEVVLSPYWESVIRVTLRALRHDTAYLAQQDRYLQAIQRGLSGSRAGLSVLLDKEHEDRAASDAPTEQGSDPIPFDDLLTTGGSRRLLHEGASRSRALAQAGSPSALEDPDQQSNGNTEIDFVLYFVSSDPESSSTVNRVDALEAAKNIVIDGALNVWTELAIEASNDVAGTFVMPAEVIIGDDAVTPRFTSGPDPLDVINLSDGSSGSASGSGDGENPIVDGQQVADGSSDDGLEGWQIALIVVAAAILIVAILLIICLFNSRNKSTKNVSCEVSTSDKQVVLSVNSFKQQAEQAAKEVKVKEAQLPLDQDADAMQASIQGEVPVRFMASEAPNVKAGPTKPFASETMPSWVSSVDSLRAEAALMARASPVAAPSSLGGPYPHTGTTSASTATFSQDAAQENGSSSALMATISEVAQELVSDVAARASGLPPTGQSLALAMKHVVTYVRKHAANSDSVFQGQYKLLADEEEMVMTASGVVVGAEKIVGGERLRVQFYCRNPAYMNEKRLRALPGLKGFFPDVIRMSPDTPDDSEPLSRWKVMKDGESLRNRIETTKFSFLEVMRVLGHVSLKLEMLHAAGFVHRNVNSKSVNWLDGEAAWTLTDLSAAYELGSDAPANLLVMSLRQCPPELVRMCEAGAAEFPVSAAADAWGLGLLAYELVSGQPLFSKKQERKAVLSALVGRTALPWEVSVDAYERQKAALGQLGETILGLLERDPRRRLRITSVRPTWTRILRDNLEGRAHE